MTKNNSLQNSDQNAFSLMEVLIAVTIVAFLISIAFTKYGETIEKQRAKEGEQILFVLYRAIKAYHMENGTASCLSSSVGVSIPASSNFDPPIYPCTVSPPIPLVEPYVTYALSVARKTGAYTLHLLLSSLPSAQVPQVTCTSATAGLCKRLGY